MNGKICCIVGAGEFNSAAFNSNEKGYIIAADGGYTHLKKIGIAPDMLLGDFDSLTDVPEHPNIVRHPVMKDDTDTLLSIKTGLSMGFRQFLIYGGTGGRIDHTIANLQALSFIAENGAQGFLIGNNFTATSVKNGSICFDESYKGTVSVFCLGNTSRGIYIDGLKYPLNNATVTPDIPIGVSNEFTDKKASVTVTDGIVTVMWYGNEDCKLPEIRNQ